ncbi:hypothetical protein BJ170DRAFT_598898 [Xylariales sp. AK1849]|nr:hypothetical protein BJ170DRAFT_598898 [Xylariales sp. AK1849]
MMKTFATISIIAALASSVSGAPRPVDNSVDFSKLDYSKVDWSNVDYSKVDYSKVDWSNVDYSKVDYSKVDWSNVDYSKVDYSKIDWSKVNYGNKGSGQWDSAAKIFTSFYSVEATPRQVVNGTGAATRPTGGLPGCNGVFNYGIIVDSNTICYKIEINGFEGNYQSPAKTATHIHQAAKGANGPPRLAFPNPVAVDGTKPEGKRVSVGCISGPFTTGLLGSDGIDTGVGFSVGQIQKDPEAFFTDVHSSLAVPGAIRGQLA